MGENGFEPIHPEETDLQSAAALQLCRSPKNPVVVRRHHDQPFLAFPTLRGYNWIEIFPIKVIGIGSVIPRFVCSPAELWTEASSPHLKIRLS